MLTKAEIPSHWTIRGDADGKISILPRPFERYHVIAYVYADWFVKLKVINSPFESNHVIAYAYADWFVKLKVINIHEA